MAEEVKEYLDYDGLVEYDKKSKELFQDLTIQDVEEAFNELDESDPSYSAFYDVIQKAKEATQSANTNAAAAEAATSKANTAATNADTATGKANEAANKVNKLVDGINDMTTGGNLLRATRNFRLGFEKAFPKAGLVQCKDGWYNNGGIFTTYVGDDGFTVIHSERTNISSPIAYCFVSPVVEIDPNIPYTISFEVMIDDVSKHDYATIFTWSFYEADGDGNANRIQYQDVSKPVIGIDKAKSGEWNQVVFSPNITVEWDSNKKHYLAINLDNYKNGSINFKKPMIQEGKINHPIYAPAPQDLVLEPVNDITTMPNLLPGTRQFLKGRKLYLGNSFYDGIGSATGYTVTEDTEGFTVYNTANPSSESGNRVIYLPVIVPTGNTMTITLFFDFKLDGPLGTNEELATIFLYKKDGTTSNLFGVSVANLGFNPEIGKWYTAVKTVTFTGIDPNTQVIATYLSTRPGCSHSFKRPGAYIGSIENPMWSESPLDIPQNRSETYGIVNKVTAKEGFTVVDAKLEVCNRVAQLYIAIDISIDINPNKTYTVATLDSSIWPALHASSASRTSANIPLVGNIGPTGVIDMCSSGTTLSTSRIYILSTYILNHSFDPSKLSS